MGLFLCEFYVPLVFKAKICSNPLPLCAYVIYGSPTEQRQPDLQRRLAVGSQPQRFVLLRGHELLPGGRGRTRLGPGRIFKSMTILKDALG